MAFMVSTKHSFNVAYAFFFPEKEKLGRIDWYIYPIFCSSLSNMEE
jgi:hypothetical protein